MKTGKRIAVSVFLIAFAFGLNITGISPVLGVLNEKYAQYGTSMVQLLQTIPYLMLIAGSLMAGFLTERFTKKKIVLAGLFIIGICGIIPFFSDRFAVLFLSRILIGYGFGITGPMNTAIISEFFQGEDRASYLGLHVVGMGVGTMVGNLAGGAFASAGFRYFFLVYLIAFASMIGVKVVLIETPPAQKKKASGKHLSGAVYAISAASFFHTLFISVYSTNISIYIMDKISDSTALSGIVTAVNAAFALLMGMLFAKVSGIFKEYTFGASVLAAAAGYGSLLVLPGMAGVFAASAFCGISLSCFMARGSYLISVAVDTEDVAQASGVFSVIGGIGGLISPVAVGHLAGLMGENSASNQFRTAFIGMLLLGCVIIGITKTGKREAK